MAKKISSDLKNDQSKIVDNNDNTYLQWSRYSEFTTTEDQSKCLTVCSTLTHAIYDGLDLQREINSVKLILRDWVILS